MRLLNYLLNYFLFAGTMFFASAPVVGDLGGGGADGGSNNGGDPNPSGGSDGATLGEPADNPTGAEGDDPGATPEDGTNPDGTARDGQGDGQQIKGVPQKFAELYKTDKDFRNLWEASKSLRQTFPGGVKEAVQLAKTIEQFGGLEGIESVKSDLDRHTANAELLSKDPVKWIESEFQAQPEAALKTFTHSLDFVAEHHPEHYDHLMAKVIFNDLKERSPMGGVYQFLSGLKDNADAQKLAKDIQDYWNQTKNISAKVPEKQKNEVLDKREQAITTKEQEIRNKTINAEVGPHMTQTIDSTVMAAAKSAGFDIAKLQKEQPNRYQRFIKDARRAVHEAVFADTAWIDRYSSALASGDTAKCVRMWNARHDQAIKGDEKKAGVVAPVFHDWFGPPKAVRREPNQNPAPVRGGGTGKETPIQVNALPPAKDIDYSDPITNKWHGIYRLKTGKVIQVKRA